MAKIVLKEFDVLGVFGETEALVIDVWLLIVVSIFRINQMINH